MVPATTFMILATVALSQAAAIEAQAHGKLSSLGWSGNGCPQGTVADLGSSADIIKASLKSFTARDADGVPNADKTKNCKLIASIIDVQPGWQVSVGKATLQGPMQLTSGANAKVQSSTFLSSDAGKTFTREDTVTSSPIAVDLSAAEQWSPCGQGAQLNVNLRLIMNKGGNGGVASFGNTGAESGVSEEVELKWRQC